MTKVVGIAGSPRKNGNSTTLMRAVLKGAAKAGATTEEVYLNELTFKGCQGCKICNKRGQCALNDELTPVIEQLRNADGWVLASPVYFDSISGQLKAFFDRCHTFIMDPDLKKIKPQLQGKRAGVIILTYEDNPRDDYYHEAKKLANYLGWMGNFTRIEIITEGKLNSGSEISAMHSLLSNGELIGEQLFK